MSFFSKKKLSCKPVVYNGIKFRTEKVLERYKFLLSCETQGLIEFIELNKKITIAQPVRKIVDGKKVLVQKGIYAVADFGYIKSDGVCVYEKVMNSKRTYNKTYELKKKILMALYKIEIKEVFNPKEII